jgi:hypothetical protein
MRQGLATLRDRVAPPPIARPSDLPGKLRFALTILRDRLPPLAPERPTAAASRRWLGGALVLGVAFGCFFALGRLTTSKSQPSASVGAQLEASSARARIPAELGGGSAAAGAVPVAILAKPRPQASRPPARPQPVQAPPSVAAAVTPAATVTPQAAAQPEPAQPTPAPTPEPARPAPAAAPAPTATGKGTSGAASLPHGSTGGGGSFDTSE